MGSLCTLRLRHPTTRPASQAVVLSQVAAAAHCAQSSGPVQAAMTARAVRTAIGGRGGIGTTTRFNSTPWAHLSTGFTGPKRGASIGCAMCAWADSAQATLPATRASQADALSIAPLAAVQPAALCQALLATVRSPHGLRAMFESAQASHGSQSGSLTSLTCQGSRSAAVVSKETSVAQKSN